MAAEQPIGASARRAKRQQSVTGVEPPVVPDVQEALQATERSGPEFDDEGSNGLPEKFDFDLDYTDSRGLHWTGHFEAHIPSAKELIQVGLVRARLAGGVAPISLDPLTSDLLEMQAHLSVVLDQAPDWASKLGDHKGYATLNRIYAEVASYEAKFWGTDSGAASPLDGD
tara:strand:- start:180 stop:689 length:510 start_codon:yes stop_codon:yes gene_type:complete